MARAGPKMQPTALKILKGETRTERLNKNEPKPNAVMPPCPDIVTGYARKVWDDLGGMLLRLGIVTEVDGLALATVCIEWARYRQMVKALRKDGAVWKSESGYKQAVPEYTIAMKSLGMVKAMLAELGATPSARARLSIKKEEEDDWGDLI